MKWFIQINSIEELRNQYKKLLIKYHPDNNPDLDTTVIMQEINSEYDICLKRFTDHHTSFQNCNHSTETELKQILNEVIGLKADIQIELIGTWIWISGNTYSIKSKLKELNFKWSSKKQMWYWGTLKHKYSTAMEISLIRAKYGSTVYKAQKDAEIAGVIKKNN